jgi:chaperone BCS1
VTDLLAWLQAEFASNDILAGATGATVIGAALVYLRRAPQLLWDAALRRFSVELTVDNDDPVFGWLDQWFAAHPYGRRARRIKASTLGHSGGFEVPAPTIGQAPDAVLGPGPGAHLFVHRGRPVLVHRRRQDDDNSGTTRRRETFTVRIAGASQRPIRALLDEARVMAEGGAGVDVWTYADRSWCRSQKRVHRAIETVALPDAQRRRIVDDARGFFEAEPWYRDRGIPYRRGYLFSGPAGTGKTSTALALATLFRRPLYVLSLGAVWGDDGLIQSIRWVPPNALLLIEDIDAEPASRARRAKRDDDEDERAPGISLSALLNAIDGAVASEGRLLIMTTNHPDRLDPALVRPGRVDLHERFELAGRDQAAALFLLFFPGETRRAARFAERMGGNWSTAALQGVLMRCANDPDRAIAEIAGSEAVPLRPTG